jgi:hypothetical protein
MSAPALTTSPDAATWRHRATCRTRHPLNAGQRDGTSPEIITRLLDEGVPIADVYYVAVETMRCITVMADGDDLDDPLHPWTRELLARYDDKVACLFMSTRGKVDRV